MQSHPLDVVVLLPAFGETLMRIFEVLLEQGLEVYPADGQWFWRWRVYRVEATVGVATMEEAFAAALTARLQMPTSLPPMHN
jgi:hypothetical protein